MAVQTGNGSSIALVGGKGSNFNTALLVTGLDMGSSSRETPSYAPLNTGQSPTLEIHVRGDVTSARQITATGLFDIADVPNNGPDIEEGQKMNATVSFPVAGVTYKDDVFIVDIAGPNLVNNELMELTVILQTTNDGAGRGWTAATPPSTLEEVAL